MLTINSLQEKMNSECTEIIKDLSFGNSLINPAAVVTDIDVREECVRKDTPHFFSAVYGEMEKAFSLLCASPNREKYFINGYAFAYNEDLRALSSDISDEQNKQIIMYNRKPDILRQDIINGQDDIYININDNFTINIVNALCHLARMGKSGADSKRTQKIRFLTGNMGEGKTIFTNYLVSSHMELFHENKVIPIKIDLTSRDVSSEVPIKSIFYKKFIQIMSDKYLSSGKFGFNADYLKSFVKICQDEKLQDAIYFHIETCAKGIKTHGLLNSIAKIYENGLEILYLIFTTALDGIDFSAYIIIDGLDNFNKDKRTKKIFRDRTKDLLSYISSVDELSYAYLIVTRRESFDYINSLEMGTGSNHDLHNFSLLPITACQMVDAKNKLTQFLLSDFNSENLENLDQLRIDDIGAYSDLSQKGANSLCGYITDLSKLTYKLINNALDLIPEEGRRLALGQVFHYNNRRIQEAYLIIFKGVLNRIELLSGVSDKQTDSENLHLLNEYTTTLLNNKSLQKKFVRQYHYIARQALMLNKVHLCFPRFFVDCSKKKQNSNEEADALNCGPLAKSNMSKCSFIPNIFDFSDPTKFSEDELSHGHYLVRLRILQLLAVSKENSHVGREDSEIIDKVCDMFGYNKTVVTIELEMLSANGLTDINTQGKSINHNYYSISKMGLYIHDKLLYDYNYISNCADYLLVHKAFGEKYLVPAISMTTSELIDDKDKYSCNFGKLLADKIINTISFASYIKRLDELEHQLFMGKKKEKFSFLLEPENNDLLFGDKMQQEVAYIADRIITGSDSPFINSIVVPEFIKSIKLKHPDLVVES